jgi:uncharacterized repeat protein (TIGR03803 family)
MTTRLWRILTPVLAACVLSLIATAAGATDTQTILYNFQGIHTKKADGANPQGGVISDSAGNLYGTTLYGGSCTYDTRQGCGIVYELSPSSTGWKETVLYTFTGEADGAYPNGNLVFDGKGNLFGTASAAGSSTACSNGCGVIFELSPKSGGGWTQSVIYAFSGQPDGAAPGGGLIFDAAGNLYGSTSNGGADACGIGCGTIFELSPASGGGWTESILYAFPSTGVGLYPVGGLVMDASGTLYGVTSEGGSTTCNPGVGCGTVFRLANVSGTWEFGLLYTFEGPRGATPLNRPVFDAAGNLYDTTAYGGATQNGVVFELSPTAVGQWKQTLLHVFDGDSNGFYPGALTIDASGNIYGTSNGVAFKLNQSTKGGWIFSVLSPLANGDAALSPLLRNSAGDFFGVSYTGGTQSVGTVYELSPSVPVTKPQ